MSNTNNAGPFQSKPSGGGCSKVLLWLFFIALVLSCLCCAGILGLGFYFQNSLKKGFVEDPVLAQEKTVQTFGELNLPENIKPRALFNLKFVGKDLGFASIYSWKVDSVPASAQAATESETSSESKPAEGSKENDSKIFDKGVIAFYSLPDILNGREKEVVDKISERITLDNNEAAVKSVETLPVTINGSANDFKFSWMENKNKQPFVMVSGSFNSKTDKTCNVLIYLQGEPSKEMVTNVLENLQ